MSINIEVVCLSNGMVMSQPFGEGVSFEFLEPLSADDIRSTFRRHFNNLKNAVGTLDLEDGLRAAGKARLRVQNLQGGYEIHVTNYSSVADLQAHINGQRAEVPDKQPAIPSIAAQVDWGVAAVAGVEIEIMQVVPADGEVKRRFLDASRLQAHGPLTDQQKAHYALPAAEEELRSFGVTNVNALPLHCDSLAYVVYDKGDGVQERIFVEGVETREVLNAYITQKVAEAPRVVDGVDNFGWDNSVFGTQDGSCGGYTVSSPAGEGEDPWSLPEGVPVADTVEP